MSPPLKLDDQLPHVWVEVIRWLCDQIEPRTWLAIGSAYERRPTDNAAGLRTIFEAIDRHHARSDPVVAFFGWLHVPTWEKGADGVYRITGLSSLLTNIYQMPASPVIAPLDDPETLAALGLCRAARDDRDRRVKVMPWMAN
jgi:hypothetical protein